MHPYFNIFGKVFPAYGVMCALGIILALILCMFRAVRARLCPMRTLIIFTFSLTFGMAGAVFTHLIVTYSPSEILLFLKNGFLESGYAPGFVFYGGLIAALLVLGNITFILYDYIIPVLAVRLNKIKDLM